jgi:hypothetical protein
MRLAFEPLEGYFASMPEKLRRAMTLLVALTFVVGLAPHGLRAAHIDVKMVMAAATDVPMSGRCNDCQDESKAMPSAACSAYCGIFVALPVTGTTFEPALAETVGELALPAPAGHTVPPDPYPPKSAVLS